MQVPGQRDAQRRAERRCQAGRERDEGSFTAGALGHLVVALAPKVRRELALEVGEEPFPPHVHSLGRLRLPVSVTPSIVLRMQTTVNDIKRTFEVLRGVAVLLGAVLLAPWLWHVAAGVGAASAAGVPVRSDEALVAVLASAALVGVCWLALSVLLELLALVPGALGRGARRVADLVTPRVVRRAAGALLGVGLVAGLAPGASVAAPVVSLARVGGAPAPGVADVKQAAASTATRPAVTAAAEPDIAGPPLPDPGFSALPDPGWAPTSPVPRSTPGGWVPTRPTVRTQPDVRVLSPSPRSTVSSRPSEVVVRRGDSLWSLAARHLGPDASDAEIAQAWPAWFETNRAVIGDDPDLLRPGQVLRPPPRSLS